MANGINTARTLLLAALAMFLVFVAGSDSAFAAGNVFTTAATFASDSSIALDAAGNPVIAYRDSLDTKLKVLHCDDPFCNPGGDVTATPDVQSGRYPSLVLDAAGNPVVSYYTTPFDRLKLLHCDDPNCAGSEPVETPDPDAILVNASTSLALDTAGNPVIAYAPTGEIRVMHCNDPECAGGDESITSHGSVADRPALVLDAAGNPVVAYSDSTLGGLLRVMHCNDPDCAGGDESVTGPDAAPGNTPAIALDIGGRPIIAYYGAAPARDLKLMHCNDANCAGSNETVTAPDSGGDVGVQPSIVLSSGNPTVAYRDETNGDLKLLRCDDPDCAGGGDSITAMDTSTNSGGNSSLTLDGSGFPAISFDAGPDVKIVRCGAANCAPAVGGLTQLARIDAEAGGHSFRLGTWLSAATAAVATVVAIGLIALLGRRAGG